MIDWLRSHLAYQVVQLICHIGRSREKRKDRNQRNQKILIFTKMITKTYQMESIQVDPAGLAGRWPSVLSRPTTFFARRIVLAVGLRREPDKSQWDVGRLIGSESSDLISLSFWAPTFSKG